MSRIMWNRDCYQKFQQRVRKNKCCKTNIKNYFTGTGHNGSVTRIKISSQKKYQFLSWQPVFFCFFFWKDGNQYVLFESVKKIEFFTAAFEKKQPTKFCIFPVKSSYHTNVSYWLTEWKIRPEIWSKYDSN